jgi:hypothetical protein
MTTSVTVMVWGRPHKISVDQKYKTVWIASGDYMGESIQVKGSTQGAAVIRWREAGHIRADNLITTPAAASTFRRS